MQPPTKIKLSNVMGYSAVFGKAIRVAREEAELAKISSWRLTPEFHFALISLWPGFELAEIIRRRLTPEFHFTVVGLRP